MCLHCSSSNPPDTIFPRDRWDILSSLVRDVFHSSLDHQEQRSMKTCWTQPVHNSLCHMRCSCRGCKLHIPRHKMHRFDYCYSYSNLPHMFCIQFHPCDNRFCIHDMLYGCSSDTARQSIGHTSCCRYNLRMHPHNVDKFQYGPRDTAPCRQSTPNHHCSSNSLLHKNDSDAHLCRAQAYTDDIGWHRMRCIPRYTLGITQMPDMFLSSCWILNNLDLRRGQDYCMPLSSI